MYREHLKTLYLNKSSLIFRNEYGTLLSRDIEVGEYCKETNFEGDTMPDFYCRGFFRKINKGLKNEFILSEKGPNILYLTGLPKIEKELAPYRITNAIYTSYWQDTSKAYLFQVYKNA